MKPKRLISLLVAVCMMITMLPLSAVTAFAEDTSSSTGTASDGTGTYKYAYTVDAYGNATITEFLGPVDPANPGPYDIDIPEKLDGYTVTGLGAYSFSGYASASPYPHNSYQIGRNIRSVDIPQGVTSIGNHAFFDCFDLENITIPQSVTSIGDVAFGCCKFTTLSLGENIETIGGGAFWHCSNLSEITIPENVKEIKNGYSENIYYRKTFEGCSHLKCIILPAGFKSFEASLRDCPTDCVIYYNNDWDPSILLGFELFGGQGLELIALGCGVCYMLSGHHGLYISQTFVTNKLRPEYASHKWQIKLKKKEE